MGVSQPIDISSDLETLLGTSASESIAYIESVILKFACILESLFALLTDMRLLLRV